MRLTMRNSDGSVSQPLNLNWAAALERLAAYEDTGLEPEVCAGYKKIEDLFVSNGMTFKHITELIQAEKDGRLVVLPCKVGQRAGVWRVAKRIWQDRISDPRGGGESTGGGEAWLN